jgi:hypothetical protein
MTKHLLNKASSKMCLIFTFTFISTYNIGFAQVVKLGDTSTQEIEVRKIQIEEQKLRIEEKKLEQQIYASMFTSLAILISAFATFFTLRINSKTLALNSEALKFNSENAKYSAKLQTKLKAIDIIMNSPGPKTAEHRLKLINQVLDEELVKPEDLKLVGIGPGHDTSRKELIKMLIDNPDKQKKIIQLWKITFGGSQSFVKDIENIERYLFDGKI